MEDRSEPYRPLPRQGETLKTQRDKWSPPQTKQSEGGPTRSKTLKSEGLPPEHTAGDLRDLSPEGGSLIKRKVDGRDITRYSVRQLPLVDAGQNQIETTRGMHQLQPNERAPQAVADGTITPGIMKDANKQNWKITRDTLQRAENKKGK